MIWQLKKCQLIENNFCLTFIEQFSTKTAYHIIPLFYKIIIIFVK